MASKASFTIDTKKLHQALQTMKRAAKDVAADAVADVWIDIAETFDAQCDPYGEPWPVRKDGKPATLVDRGTLVKSRKIISTPTGELTVTYSSPHAVNHQFGAPRAHLPKRQLVPSADRGIPAKWMRILKRAFKTVLGKAWA